MDVEQRQRLRDDVRLRPGPRIGQSRQVRGDRTARQHDAFWEARRARGVDDQCWQIRVGFAGGEWRSGRRIDHDSRQPVERGRQLGCRRDEDGLRCAVTRFVRNLGLAGGRVEWHDRHAGYECTSDAEPDCKLGRAPKRNASLTGKRRCNRTHCTGQVVTVEAFARNLERGTRQSGKQRRCHSGSV